MNPAEEGHKDSAKDRQKSQHLEYCEPVAETTIATDASAGAECSNRVVESRISVSSASPAPRVDGPPTEPSEEVPVEEQPAPEERRYIGFGPRTVQLMWEQHEGGGMEMTDEACAAIAEDVTYRLYNIVKTIKTYARHSGGKVTYELVNEVFRDCDIPPTLGALDSDFERIDYDGAFYFYSDRILGLREEYQKEVKIEIPYGPEVVTSVPVQAETLEHIKTYIPNLLQLALHGEYKAAGAALIEATRSPITGTCYKLILDKIIQILAFKQSDPVSARCWALIRACCTNKYVRSLDCREQFFHLAEILICQLLAPYQTIIPTDKEEDPIPMEMDDPFGGMTYETSAMQAEYGEEEKELETFPLNSREETFFKLVADEDTEDPPRTPPNSEYFAWPVEDPFVEELCHTIGVFAASDGYLHSECMHNILRRLEKFFEGRLVHTRKEFLYLHRALSGLIVLGDFAFREATPYFYKFNPEDMPESNVIARAAAFLNGPDDIFFYEWLEVICGNDKLQPYMVYHHKYHSKLQRLCLEESRKRVTFRIKPSIGVRCLEWNISGADSNKTLKPKPTLNQVFPELKTPKPTPSRRKIEFKISGSRPIALTGTRKVFFESPQLEESEQPARSSTSSISTNDILIARRRLLKTITNTTKHQRVHNLLDYIM